MLYVAQLMPFLLLHETRLLWAYQAFIQRIQKCHLMALMTWQGYHTCMNLVF